MLYAALQKTFDRCAEQMCLIDPAGDDWRYARLETEAGRLGRVLEDAGVVPGDRVLVQVEKSSVAVGLYIACLRIGAVYVPLNTAYTTEEVDYFIADAEPRVFVCGSGHPQATYTLAADGTGTLSDAAAGVSDATSPVPRGTDDLAAILYTSGTTGRSKGAMLTHGNLLSNAETLRGYWGWRDDDVLLHALPIFHVHGLFVAMHCAMLGGTAMVFLPRFDADVLLDWLPGATVMMGVPTFYTRLLDHPRFTRELCANMRLFISGSAPLTEQTFTAWQARTGHEILERYGMSETLMNTSNPLVGERVAGTVGFALPGTEARIADENGQPLATGEVGIIEVRGPNVFKGYWRMPEKTAEEFRDDGFFVTGDLGQMDGEGRVSIVGRAKDLVISGGYNVYPKEVERVIDEMPGVLESAVIGVPHADFGEAVVAVVVPETAPVGEDEVAAALAGRLARFKQPKRVLCVDALPRNAMGKVQKNELRERFTGLFD
jgi:malonyl-CoA/methylmalonyl-CoA synthetase